MLGGGSLRLFLLLLLLRLPLVLVLGMRGLLLRIEERGARCII
jgi:hypothetical protein